MKSCFVIIANITDKQTNWKTQVDDPRATKNNKKSPIDMRYFLLLFLLQFCYPTAHAQPNYDVESFYLNPNLSPNKYLKTAKKSIKANDFNKALLNATYALRVAEKKSKIIKAQNYLRQYYVETIEANVREINDLKQQTTIFLNDETVTKSARILNLYLEMNSYCGPLYQLRENAFTPLRKKDLPIILNIQTYANEISSAQNSLNENIELAAKMNYEKGTEMAHNETKTGKMQAARYYKWADEYLPGYRDAYAQYLSLKKLATIRMGLTTFKNNNPSQGEIGDLILNKVSNAFLHNQEEFEFFDVIDRRDLNLLLAEQNLNLSGALDESTAPEIGKLVGVDLLLVGTILLSQVDRQLLLPYLNEYNREIVASREKYEDDKGKERFRDIKEKVTAVVQINEKLSNAMFHVTYKVIDVSSGQVVYSGETKGQENWNYIWMTSFTGDKRALPSGLPIVEVTFPAEIFLLETAVNVAAQNLFFDIKKYVSKYENKSRIK